MVLLLFLLAVAGLIFGLGVLYTDAAWAVGDQHDLADYFVAPGRAPYAFQPVGVIGLIAGGVCGLAAAIWLVVGSVFGFVRLVSGQPIGGR